MTEAGGSGKGKVHGEQYQACHGQAASQDRSRAWLIDAMTTGLMRAFLVRGDGGAAGVCLVAMDPRRRPSASSG